MNNEELKDLLEMPSAQCWDSIRGKLLKDICAPIEGSIVDEIINREKQVKPVDHALAGSAWSLWHTFQEDVPRASQRLAEWWNDGPGGKAVLILDGLSIREAPLVLSEAKKRGFSIEEFDVLGSELPAETNAFAKAMGLSHRGALDNNGAGNAHKMTGAHTLTNNLPWKEVENLIPNSPKVFAWHQWPDKSIHEYSDQGAGIRKLLPEMIEKLCSDEFWNLIAKLTQGRELIITSDHGYADVGSFRDANAEEKTFYKDNFGGYRYKKTELTNHEWLPPLALTLDCPSGRYSMALGRAKWAVSGGNRTLSHGGLSLFDTIVPFIKIKSK